MFCFCNDEDEVRLGQPFGVIEPGEGKTHKRHKSSCWHVGLSPGKIWFHSNMLTRDTGSWMFNQKAVKWRCSNSHLFSTKVVSYWSAHTVDHSVKFVNYVHKDAQSCLTMPLSSENFTETHMSLVLKWFAPLFYFIFFIVVVKKKRVCS